MKKTAQLYNLVATGINIKGKDILEVGCGRGGGLSYINRYLSPHSATGVDLNKKAIEFCKTYYSNRGIKFIQANAQSLNFQDKVFDVVINIESSHRYSQMDIFLDEVFRVLKPGGYFLFADFRHDFRHKSKIETLNKHFEDSNLRAVKYEIITTNVLEALKLSTNEREKLIHKIIPKLLHSIGKKFAATEGSTTYNKFSTREYEYFFYIFKK
jgi:ubiquinone/menaquinone biosynthesis C-methylase UbiE